MSMPLDFSSQESASSPRVRRYRTVTLEEKKRSDNGKPRRVVNLALEFHRRSQDMVFDEPNAVRIHCSTNGFTGVSILALNAGNDPGAEIWWPEGDPLPAVGDNQRPPPLFRYDEPDEESGEHDKERGEPDKESQSKFFRDWRDAVSYARSRKCRHGMEYQNVPKKQFYIRMRGQPETRETIAQIMAGKAPESRSHPPIIAADEDSATDVSSESSGSDDSVDSSSVTRQVTSIVVGGKRKRALVVESGRSAKRRKSAEKERQPRTHPVAPGSPYPPAVAGEEQPLTDAIESGAGMAAGACLLSTGPASQEVMDDFVLPLSSPPRSFDSSPAAPGPMSPHSPPVQALASGAPSPPAVAGEALPTTLMNGSGAEDDSDMPSMHAAFDSQEMPSSQPTEESAPQPSPLRSVDSSPAARDQLSPSPPVQPLAPDAPSPPAVAGEEQSVTATGTTAAQADHPAPHMAMPAAGSHAEAVTSPERESPQLQPLEQPQVLPSPQPQQELPPHQPQEEPANAELARLRQENAELKAALAEANDKESMSPIEAAARQLGRAVGEAIDTNHNHLARLETIMVGVYKKLAAGTAPPKGKRPQLCLEELESSQELGAV